MRAASNVEAAVIDLKSVARRYVQTRCHVPDRASRYDIHDVELTLDLDYCAEVARCYTEWPSEPENPEVKRSYEQLKQEIAAQWDALVAAGLTILPWLGAGQPYANSNDLCAQVLSSGTLYVFLTRCGHGPCGELNPNHPMTADSRVRIGNETLLHNDLFRAAHDAFGHVMSGNKFSLSGEFKAAYDHRQMFSDEATPALLAETIGQICWFYCGPHLVGRDGRLARKGDPGYVPLRDRPYPPQKAMLLPGDLVSGFEQLFERKCA